MNCVFKVRWLSIQPWDVHSDSVKEDAVNSALQTIPQPGEGHEISGADLRSRAPLADSDDLEKALAELESMSVKALGLVESGELESGCLSCS